VLDKAKMDRAKAKVCHLDLIQHKKDMQGLTCISCDSKIDKECLEYKELSLGGEAKTVKVKAKVDHLSFTAESGPLKGRYLTQKDISSSTGSNLAGITHSVLEEFNSTETLMAIVFDNTPSNTGHKTGLCACLERLLGRTIHQIGCMLHLNELPLRHVIAAIDGVTNDPAKYSGPIGKEASLQNSQKPQIKFIPVHSNLVIPPEDIISDLSADQRLLLEYIVGIQNGFISPIYVNRQIGPCNHARWLTLAIRILVVYSRTESPSEKLIAIVSFICQVYGPCWFEVKQARDFTVGPKIIFQVLQWINTIELDGRVTDRSLIDTLKYEAIPVVERNAYSLLSENFILSLLVDKEIENRRRGHALIVKARNAPTEKYSKVYEGFRPNQIGKINLTANTWDELISDNDLKFEPPVTKHLLEADLLTFVEKKTDPDEMGWDFPIHSQSVERAVRLVSEVSKAAYTTGKRHQLAVTKQNSRIQRPLFKNKSKYQL
jgi:hypothetical protein